MSKPIHFLYETDRIGVCGLSERELAGNYPNWFSDMEVCQHNRHGVFPMSYSQVEQFVRSLAGNNSQIVWAIYDKASMTHIGNMSLQNINLLDRNAEFAVIFGEKKFHGLGYAAEAADLLLKHGFERLNLHRIYCGTASTNISMRRLADKMQMQQEGVRKDALYLNGEYVDIVEFGVLKSEYQC